MPENDDLAAFSGQQHMRTKLGCVRHFRDYVHTFRRLCGFYFFGSAKDHECDASNAAHEVVLGLRAGPHASLCRAEWLRARFRVRARERVNYWI